MSRAPGRPKGVKNAEYATAVELPACCPACGSANLKALPNSLVNSQDYAGEIQGRAYMRVEWHNKQCECGQRVRVRRYLP